MTGFRCIENLCRENGTKPPGYDFTGFFTTTYVRESYSAPEAPVELSVTETKILQFLSKGVKSRSELLESLGYKLKSGNFKNAIRHLMKIDFIGYTIPDKPNSRLQRYRVTGKGKQVITEQVE